MMVQREALESWWLREHYHLPAAQALRRWRGRLPQPVKVEDDKVGGNECSVTAGGYTSVKMATQ